MKKVIFVCCTPYQLLNAINLKTNNYYNDICDIVLVNHYKDAKRYYEVLRNKDFFDSIYFLDLKKENTTEKKNLAKNLYKRINKYFITTKDYIENFEIKNYDELIIGNNLYFSNVLFADIKRINNKAIVNLLEDGLGTYVKKFEILDRKTIQRNKLFRRYFIEEKNISKALVYNTSLLSFKSTYKFEEVPIISDEVFNKIVELLEIKIEKIKMPRIIYFDQPFTLDGVNISEVNVMEDILREYKEVAIKLHPRQLKSRYEKRSNVSFIENLEIPWEIAIKFIDNIEECKFITVNSTAVFTPGILYGKKVDILLLNDKFKSNKGYEETEIFIEKFKKEYL